MLLIKLLQRPKKQQIKKLYNPVYIEKGTKPTTNNQKNPTKISTRTDLELQYISKLNFNSNTCFWLRQLSLLQPSQSIKKNLLMTSWGKQSSEPELSLSPLLTRVNRGEKLFSLTVYDRHLRKTFISVLHPSASSAVYGQLHMYGGEELHLNKEWFLLET